MNLPRLLSREAAHVAECGDTVLIIDRKGPAGDLESIQSDSTNDMVTRVRKANGAEGIDYLGGGRVSFFRSASAARGHSADQVYFAHGLSSDEIADLIPCLATADEHVLIGY